MFRLFFICIFTANNFMVKVCHLAKITVIAVTDIFE